jgi:hypothetical protein
MPRRQSLFDCCSDIGYYVFPKTIKVCLSNCGSHCSTKRLAYFYLIIFGKYGDVLNDPARPAAARPVSFGPGRGTEARAQRGANESTRRIGGSGNPYPVETLATNLPWSATAGSS